MYTQLLKYSFILRGPCQNKKSKGLEVGVENVLSLNKLPRITKTKIQKEFP